MQFKVSVIIPTFNRAHSLPRAIDSVLGQSFSPLEVIVVDDGSTDDTRELVSSYHPLIQYHHQPNTGVSSARNLGIKVSEGNWLAFLDSDDEWLPDKLKQQVRALSNKPEFSLCHTDEIWIRNGVRVNPMNKHEKGGGYIFDKCLLLCAISPSSVLIKREFLLETGGFDEALPACEDYDLWLRICAINPVLYLAQELIRKFGGHDDQLSRRYWGMDRFRVQSLEKLLAAGRLNESQSEAVFRVLAEKCRILADGASKRDKRVREQFYRQKQWEYESQLLET